MPALKEKAARAAGAGPADAPKAAAYPAAVPAEEDHFIPLHALQNILRFWWFVFSLMVAGGLLGLLVSSMQPPLYEAVGRFSLSIDFVSTGPMTQFEEDIALNAVSSVLVSSALIDEIVARAGEGGVLTSAAELQQAVSLERKVSDWELRLRLPDPDRAERLTNIWVELGQAKLLESHQQALQAEQLRRTLRALENCLQQAAASEPAAGVCEGARFTEIQDDLQSVGQQYAQALIASQSISPALRVGPPALAQVSARPVMHARGLLVLAGCFLGFLLGISLVPLGFPARWIK